MKWLYSTLFFAALCSCALPMQAADLPDGDGKALLERECDSCHDTGRISGQKKTKDAWIDTVSRMMTRGASLNDKEFDTVIAYLVKNFGKDDSKIGSSVPAKRSTEGLRTR
jgi:hypothetical protein